MQKQNNFSFRYLKKVAKIKPLFILDIFVKITTHSHRHTFITRAKEKGVAEHVLQTWVGHEIGSKMTSSIYTHIDKTFENKCVDIMNL